MIELTELTKKTIETIIPFLLAGGDKVMEAAASDLWGKIKHVLTKKNSAELITKLEAAPEDMNTQEKIASILELELKTNNDLAKDFVDLIASIKTTENYKTIVKQVGNQNIAITGKVISSTINITHPKPSDN